MTTTTEKRTINRIQNDLFIKVLTTDHNIKTGKRGKAMSALRNGMSVAELRDALQAKKIRDYASFVVNTGTRKGILRLVCKKSLTAARRKAAPKVAAAVAAA